MGATTNNRTNQADTSLSYRAADNNTSFISQGMAAEVIGYPFTSNQWKELERQAMIYKYIRDSIPVPPHLLLPSIGDHSSMFTLNFKLPTNCKDLEPGRCKRTDGKKWRCARDVAPHQKYCERHLHRGRPRSRKPVEIHNDSNNISNKKSRPDQQIPPSFTNNTPAETPFYLFQPDLSVSSRKEFTRCLDWDTEERWNHSLGRNVGLISGESNNAYTNASIFQHDFFQDHLIPITNDSDTFNFFENQLPQVEIGLDNAWSNEDPHSNESSGKLSPSSLSVSMGMTTTGSNEMGLSMGDTDYENHHGLDLINLGGPLAEVLGGMSRVGSCF